MYHKYKMHKYFKSFNYQRSIEIPCAWSQLREMLTSAVTYTGVGPGGVIKQKSQKPLLWDVNWVCVCVVIKEIPWAGLHHSGRTGSGRRFSHQRGGGGGGAGAGWESEVWSKESHGCLPSNPWVWGTSFSLANALHKLWWMGYKQIQHWFVAFISRYRLQHGFQLSFACFVALEHDDRRHCCRRQTYRLDFGGYVPNRMFYGNYLHFIFGFLLLTVDIILLMVTVSLCIVAVHYSL
jgi:hypothetical protein